MEVRREQLLDAAIRVIVREGYDGVSVEAIAREAGVTRPVVYGAFDRPRRRCSARCSTGSRRGRSSSWRTALPDQLDPAVRRPDAIPARRGPGHGRARPLNDPLTWRPILLAPQGHARTSSAVRIDADRELVRGYLAGRCVGGRAAAARRSTSRSPRTRWSRRWSTSAGCCVEDARPVRARTGWSGSRPGILRCSAPGTAHTAAADPTARAENAGVEHRDAFLVALGGQRARRHRDRRSARPPAAAVPGRRRCRRRRTCPACRRCTSSAEVVLLGLLPPLLYAAAIRHLPGRLQRQPAARSCCCRWGSSCSRPSASRARARAAARRGLAGGVRHRCRGRRRRTRWPLPRSAAGSGCPGGSSRSSRASRCSTTPPRWSSLRTALAATAGVTSRSRGRLATSSAPPAVARWSAWSSFFVVAWLRKRVTDPLMDTGDLVHGAVRGVPRRRGAGPRLGRDRGGGGRPAAGPQGADPADRAVADRRADQLAHDRVRPREHRLPADRAAGRVAAAATSRTATSPPGGSSRCAA